MAYDKINAEIIPEGFEIHPNFQNLEPEMKVAVMSGIKGDKGDKGDTGQNGQDGQNGAAATIAVGTVTTGTPSTPASVTNVGTSTAAVFDFVIPKGDKGDPGSGGGGATGFNINFTYESDEWSCDQTYSDLVDAIGDGEIINAVISIGGVDYEGQFLYDSNNDFVIFTYVLDENMFGWVKLDYDGLFVDGSFSVPTDTSDLTNTAGYITINDVNYPVTSVNSKTGAVTLTASDVGALSSSTHIPSVPDFFYIAFTYSNGTLTASESFADTANAIADGLFADASLTYGTNTYRMNTVWDDNGQVIDYIKFVTADGIYTITYTNNDLSIDTNSYSSAFDVVITEVSNELTCNATMLDILNAVWQGKTLNAVFNSSGDSVSLAYYVYTDENYGYVDFYGISQFGYVIGIKYSVADGLEYKQTPYSIYNVITDRAYSDANGNSITTTYATKSELPTNISDLNNDSGYITSSDIPVTSVNSKTGAVSLTATDVGALPSSTVIPPKTVWYGTSSTTGSTTTKVVTTSSGDFTLTSGNVLIVKFTYGHSASSLGSNMKLKVDGLDAKVMGITNSSYISQYEWSDGAVMEFLYDGSQFIITNGRHAGTSSYGVTILSSSTTSTSESAAATPKAVKTVMDAIPTVPTNVSAFTNDAGYLTSAPVTSVNSQTGAVTLSIPSKTSDLNNDSNFITASALSGYVASSATSTIFVQDTTPSTSSDGDIWIDTSQDAIPAANGEEF